LSEEQGVPISWARVQREAAHQLTGAGIDDADLEARRLVEAATGAEGADYVLELHENATVKRLGAFDAMLSRRIAGEPLQYVIGSWSFRTLDLLVNSDVLIPRPETEYLVELALGELAELEPARGEQLVAVDMGTGSGAIGLSLAAEHDGVEVWLTDLSSAALGIARSNLAGIGGSAAVRVRVSEGSWFDALPAELQGTVSLIASNPPYICTNDKLPLSVLDWEPTTALFSGADGLDDIRQILAGAARWLRPGGRLVMELAPDQQERVVELAAESGLKSPIVMRDQYGQSRVLIART
jgi:release factor glutamine methyltransferase